MGFPAPWLIALAVIFAVLAAIPTRRLSDAGIRPGWLAAYMVTLVVLGVTVVAVRGAARFLVPFLVVLYIAPLVAAPETTARWLSRGRRPPRPVGSGPGRDVGPEDHPTPGPDDPTPSAHSLAPGPDDRPTPAPEDRPTPGPEDRPTPGPEDHPAP